jgi:hypothetical protein
MAHSRPMFGFLRRWFWPQRKRVAGVQAAPHTLVSRIDQSIADADMIRLAQESMRRGYPDQAEAAYAKAAQLYGAHGMHRKAVAVHKALAELRPDDAEPWEAAAVSYLSLGLARDAANALRKASIRHQKNGFPDQAQAALRKARHLEDQGPSPQTGASGAVEPPPPESEPVPSPSEPMGEEDIESLVREGLKLDLSLSSEDMEAFQPKTPTSLGPESAASVHVRPHPSAPPAESEPDTLPPSGHPTLAGAQTQYDPRGSAALQEARRRMAAGRLPGDNTKSADQVELQDLLEKLKQDGEG